MGDSENIRETIRQQFQAIQSYYDELNGESPRAAAILVMISLEDEIERLIRKKFPSDLSNTKWDKICGAGPKPLGTFEAKRDMAYAFGLFGSETYGKLKTLATIRNKFAHLKGVRSFLDDSVLKDCRKLQPTPIPNANGSDKPSENDVRSLYMWTAQDIHERLEELADHIPEIDGPLDPLP